MGRDILAVYRPVGDTDELYRQSFFTNLDRTDLSPLDTAEALSRISMMDGYSIAKAGKEAGMSQPTAHKYIRLLRLCPEARALLDPNLVKKKRLPVTLAAKIGDLKPEFQLDFVKAFEAGGKSATQLIHQIDLLLLENPATSHTGRRTTRITACDESKRLARSLRIIQRCIAVLEETPLELALIALTRTESGKQQAAEIITSSKDAAHRLNKLHQDYEAKAKTKGLA